MQQGKSINELTVGEKATMKRVYTDEDVRTFAKLSGDSNPLHLDEEYASKTKFKHRIVHGHLTSSMFSNILGTTLPGLGTIYFIQNLKYIAPVYIGEEITYEVTINEINVEKNRVKFDTNAFNQEGQIVIKGEAVALPPKKVEE